MSQNNDKTPQDAPRSPATGGEISWILLLLGLCLILNGWLGALSPEPQDLAKAPTPATAQSGKAAAAKALAPVAPPMGSAARPERERPAARGDAERGSRAAMPGF